MNKGNGKWAYWQLPKNRTTGTVPEPPPDSEEARRQALERVDADISAIYQGRPMHYNRKGEPIKFSEWGMLFEDMDYKRVKQTFVGRFGVSTVWLGHDHSFSMNGPPIIFEAMVVELMEDGSWNFRDDLGMWRYSTEEDAAAHHERLIAKLKEQCGDGETNVEPQLWDEDDEDEV